MGQEVQGPKPSPTYFSALQAVSEQDTVTKRMRLRMQATEMSLLRRVPGLSLRDGVRSSDIQRELGVEPLLLGGWKELAEVVRASD